MKVDQYLYVIPFVKCVSCNFYQQDSISKKKQQKRKKNNEYALVNFVLVYYSLL